MFSFKNLFDTVKVTEAVRICDGKKDEIPASIFSCAQSEDVYIYAQTASAAYATHAEAAAEYAVEGTEASGAARYILRIKSTVTLGEYLACWNELCYNSESDLNDDDTVDSMCHECFGEAVYNWLRYVVGHDTPDRFPEPQGASIFDADPAQVADSYANYIYDRCSRRGHDRSDGSTGADERYINLSWRHDEHVSIYNRSMQWSGGVYDITARESSTQLSSGYAARQLNTSIRRNVQMTSDEDSVQVAKHGWINQLSAGKLSYQYADAYESRQAATGVRTTQIAAASGSRQASCGSYSNHLASGRGSRQAVAGNNVQLKTTAENCVMMSAGHGGAACGKVGSWIVLTEWVNGEPAVVAKRIDGVEIKADTWYTLRGGKLVETKPRA